MGEQQGAAKQAMEQWLADPHELGKLPAKIECAGTFEMEGMVYYIFRYKKGVLGKWLLGVSGGYEAGSLEHCGHVFSEMQPYDEANAQQEAAKMVEMIRAYWKKRAEEMFAQ